MHELAEEVVRSSVSITGVQAKLSVDLTAATGPHKKRRLTIVGMWGRYVLKPPSEDYPALPEIEDLSMHIAEAFKLRTVPHTLIRIATGELAYITRRIDRSGGRKLHMEDMCQLTERLTEDKYKGSLEQIGKKILRFSDNPGFDMLELLRLSVVCFLTGNADMHLKNFSLLHSSDGSIGLAPAYDVVATAIVLPEEREESALTINGKKSRLREQDFAAFARTFGIAGNVYGNTIQELHELMPKAHALIAASFLSRNAKNLYSALLTERSSRLGI
jgi:serine/threonine-protein kinase HipA